MGRSWHFTYLINRVGTRALEGKTPYEDFRGKTPNGAHLKVFGCICFAKTDTVGIKKLDDMSRMLVHLGTEPGSKAYRLYDPLTKKIVVSRDVVFDESKGWNWTKGGPVQGDGGESFSITLRKDARSNENELENEAETYP